MFLIILSAIIILIVVVLKIYVVVTLGKCSSRSKLNGKVALVTGSNRGMGYCVALNLAKRGARVIITSENFEDLQRAQKQLIEESGNKDIVAKHLDFLSLAGVRAFAKDILETESRLDILVNNAGSFIGIKATKDGLLPIMQINYFGPFLLTNLLLGLLKKSAPSRIVNVASVAASLAFCFDSHNINKNAAQNIYFAEFFEYCNSKACVASSTIEMAKRLKRTGVTVNCLHPGLVYTEIWNTAKTWTGLLADLGRFIAFKTVQEGAETTIHLAACEKIEGVTGKHFSDCRPSWVTANLGAEVRNRIWEQSVQLTGLKSEEMLL